MYKLCIRCKEIKFVYTGFAWKNKKLGQFQTYCKECRQKEQNFKYNNDEKYRQNILKRCNDWYYNGGKEYQKEYWNIPENRERRNARSMELYYGNPEIRQYLKEYYSTPERKEIARVAALSYNNLESTKERKKQWNEEYYSVPENYEKKLKYNSERRQKLREEIIKNSNNDERDHILYILHFINESESFYKIGVTGLGISERYNFSDYKGYSYKILYVGYYSKEYAYKFEGYLLYEHRTNIGNYIFSPKSKFSGFTECFPEIDQGFLRENGIELNYNNEYIKIKRK